MSRPLDFRPPHLIHEFPEGELVKDMAIIQKRKHWYSRKKAFMYVTTSKGMYELEAK